MSLRAALLLLLFANLAFFGWAQLVDVPPSPPPNDSISHLPRLELLSEAQGQATLAKPAPSTATAPPPAAAKRPTSSSSSSSQSSVPPIASASASSASSQSAQRCVTVGPFNDPNGAAQAVVLLEQRGFKLRQRTEQGPEQGYWVYVGGFKSTSEESVAIRRLQQNGISDAHAMPASEGGRRVSVGFFNERDGAERRARAVRGLGLSAQIEKRGESEAGHWVDVDLDSSSRPLPSEELLSLQENGSRLEIKECSEDWKQGRDGKAITQVQR